MSYDPYGEDPDDIFDEDDDQLTSEFEEEDPDLDARPAHKHTIDGTECPTCEVIHNQPFRGSDPRAEEAILTFFDAMPDEFVAEILDGSSSSKKKPQAELITHFLGFADRLDHSNRYGPAIRAIIEHLDEQTGGRITAKWKFYDVERRIVITHKLLKSLTITRDNINNFHEINEKAKGLLELLNMLTDYLHERLVILEAEYRNAASDVDEEPCQELIDTGKHPAEKLQDLPDIAVEELLKEITL